MDETEPAPETRKLLDEIRHSDKVLSLYDMPADPAEAGER